MKIHHDIRIRDVLTFDEEKMISRLVLLLPAFERLNRPVKNREYQNFYSMAA